MKKVVVIGSANIDVVYEVERLPKLGETIEGINIEKFAGGKGLNQAVACSRVHDRTIFLGSFGNTIKDTFLLDHIKKENLDINHLLDSQKEAGTAIITRCQNDNTIVVIASANNDVSIEYIKENEYLINENTIVVLQNEIKQEVNEYIINYCFENKVTIVYNPAPARKISDELINKVDFLTLNETEAQYLFSQYSLAELVEKYPKKVIVTVGKDGALYFDKTLINIKPPKVKVVDTTGAGDTLNGILAASLAKGFDLATSLNKAVIGASISTTKVGAQKAMPTTKELEI